MYIMNSLLFPTLRQGLSYGDDGFIYETTGLNGQSKVRKINSTTFDVNLSVNVNSQYFGEGSAFYKDANGSSRLIVITWQSQTGFIYDDKLQKLKDFTYKTTAPGNEGWGITYDASKKEFIVSDGSKYLYFWDRDTLSVKRYVTVTRLNGSEQKNLNELEYMGGLVCCNIWYSDTIICVDPLTGKSIREYGMLYSDALFQLFIRVNTANACFSSPKICLRCALPVRALVY